MAEAPNPKRSIPIEADATGNTTLWDHGPQKRADADPEETKKYEADLKAWREANGEGPALVTMATVDAAHARAAEPKRYSAEPNVEESAIAAKIKEIQAQREAARKATEKAAAAAQLTEDRKVAIAAVMADQKAAEEAKKAKAGDV